MTAPEQHNGAEPNVLAVAEDRQNVSLGDAPQRRSRKRGAGEGTITRRKDGTWRGQLMVGRRLDGKPDRRSVYGKTRAEVQAKLDALRRSAQSGALPPAKSLTFGEFLERWLRDSVRLSVRPKTYESYRQQARTHVIPALGGHKLATLAPAVIQHYYAAKLATGLSPTTVKYHHAIIHRALRQAVRWGLAPPNAAEVVDPPRVRREEMKFLLPEQVAALLATAKQAEDRLAALWALAVYSGARQGELLALRWSDVDEAAGTLTIHRALERVVAGVGVYAEPKTASSLRTVTLAEGALELLREHRQLQDEEKRLFGSECADEGLVFCTQRGRPLDRTNVYRDFHLALGRANLPLIRFHDLRHTSATLLLLAGVHLKTAGGRLGHSDTRPRPSTATSCADWTRTLPGAWGGRYAPGRERHQDNQPRQSSPSRDRLQEGTASRRKASANPVRQTRRQCAAVVVRRWALVAVYPGTLDRTAISTERYPHISADPDVQGGTAVVRGTRLPVRAVAFYWRETGDRARILIAYPQLTPETLDEALRYYEDHRAEIDEELRDEAEVA